MDGVITKRPVEIVADEVVDEIDSLLTIGEVDSGRAEAPASMLLNHFATIEWSSEIGVPGDISITFGDFRITFPEK
jgi:hypothetical protein